MRIEKTEPKKSSSSSVLAENCNSALTIFSPTVNINTTTKTAEITVFKRISPIDARVVGQKGDEEQNRDDGEILKDQNSHRFLPVGGVDIFRLFEIGEDDGGG